MRVRGARWVPRRPRPRRTRRIPQIPRWILRVPRESPSPSLGRLRMPWAPRPRRGCAAGCRAFRVVSRGRRLPRSRIRSAARDPDVSERSIRIRRRFPDPGPRRPRRMRSISGISAGILRALRESPGPAMRRVLGVAPAPGVVRRSASCREQRTGPTARSRPGRRVSVAGCPAFPAVSRGLRPRRSRRPRRMRRPRRRCRPRRMRPISEISAGILRVPRESPGPATEGTPVPLARTLRAPAPRAPTSTSTPAPRAPASRAPTPRALASTPAPRALASTPAPRAPASTPAPRAPASRPLAPARPSAFPRRCGRALRHPRPGL